MLRQTSFARRFLILALLLSIAGSSGGGVVQAQDTPPGDSPAPLSDSPLFSAAGDAPALDEELAMAVAATAGLNYQSFSGILFRPYDSSIKYGYNFNQGTMVLAEATMFPEFILPLELPNGVDIREITVWFRDNSVTKDISFCLCRVQNGDTATGCAAWPVNVANNGNTGSVVSRTLMGAPIMTVDNANYSYSLIASVPVVSNQFGLVSARIGYAASTYLPVITQ